MMIVSSPLAGGAVAAGVPPVSPDAPPAVVEAITRITQLAFMDGMHTAFTVSAALAVVPIVLAFRIKAGRRQEGPTAAHVRAGPALRDLQPAAPGRPVPAGSPGGPWGARTPVHH
ncbi:hypothetical protein [Plantactinospora sp. CA-290183]|uniref:hypothetical protein n=1 Tax=Plantactinospora sp. CA-290183 TaxID=3240006 RepID=UPI003D939593